MAIKEIPIANQDTLLQVQETVNSTEARLVGADSVARNTINAVDNLANIVGTATPEAATIMAALKILIDRPTGSRNSGAVKRILWGTHAGTSNVNNITIPLAEEVNPDMCVVYLNSSISGFVYGGNYEGGILAPSFYSLSPNELIVTTSSRRQSSSYHAVPFSWQLVEYNDITITDFKSAFLSSDRILINKAFRQCPNLGKVISDAFNIGSTALKGCDTIEELVNNTDAFSTIIENPESEVARIFFNNSQVSETVAASATIMALVTENPIMATIAASKTAMKAMATNSVSRAAIVASSAAKLRLQTSPLVRTATTGSIGPGDYTIISGNAFILTFNNSSAIGNNSGSLNTVLSPSTRHTWANNTRGPWTLNAFYKDFTVTKVGNNANNHTVTYIPC